LRNSIWRPPNDAQECGRASTVACRDPEPRGVLIWIDDWDFNWQGQYQYRSPVTLVKGSVIKLDAYYDNSAENPSNPSNPPRRVRWGEQTTDEMCLLGVQVVTDNLADLRKIVAMRGNRLGAALVGGDGGPLGDRAGVRFQRRARAQLEAGGFPIAERFQQQLGRFATNRDGKLSATEIDAMPEAMRNRVRQAIQSRTGVGNAPGP
jgi:hypothetical protein